MKGLLVLALINNNRQRKPPVCHLAKPGSRYNKERDFVNCLIEEALYGEFKRGEAPLSLLPPPLVREGDKGGRF
jgi:hypothetical protein